MKIKNKSRFITAIIILFTLLIITGNLSTKACVIDYKTIYVAKGETLWSIAKKYKQENQDIRDYIYQLKKVNNMDTSIIYEGQELNVIIYEEAK